jgi:isoamyl acetate esterase
VFAKKEEQRHVPGVRLVTIWFGANDACLPGSPQHVPLPRFTANIEHYLTSLTSPSSEWYIPSANIILITPPPLVESMREQVMLAYPPDQRFKGREIDVSRAYQREVLRIGQEWKVKGKNQGAGSWNVGVVDLWKALVDKAGGEGDLLIPYFTWVLVYRGGVFFLSRLSCYSRPLLPPRTATAFI